MATDLDAGPVLVQDKLADRVAGWLRDSIMAGRLRPGENLRLVALAERLGVSTTPVREALALLHKEGLVEGEPRRGFRVARLSRSDIRDLFLLHSFIAGLLAERAAAALSDAEIDQLAELNAQIKQAVQQGELMRAVELNHEFHRTVNKAAGPTVLLRFLADMSRWTTREVPGWPAAAGKDHSSIIRALRRRDGELARTLTQRHVRSAGQRVVAHLHENGAVD